MGHSNSLISLLKLPSWLKITSQRYSFIEGIASNKWRVISLFINVVVFMLMATLMVSPSLLYCHFALSSFHSTKGAISFHVTRQIVQRISETLLSILSKEQLHPCWNYKEKCLKVYHDRQYLWSLVVCDLQVLNASALFVLNVTLLCFMKCQII